MSDGQDRRCPIPVPWILLIAVVLRVVFIGAKPFQVDECWTFFVATDDASLWENTTFEKAFDTHPFLFYVLYRFLAPVIQGSEVLFRMPVALFSIASVVAYYFFLARTKLTPNMQRWNLLLFAVLPANVFYAYDARAYSLAQLVGIGVMYFYLAYRDCGGAAYRIGFAIAVGLSSTFDVIGLSPILAVGLDAVYSFLRRSRSGTARTDDQKESYSGSPIGSAVTIVAGMVLAVPYFYLRWRQQAATGQADQIVKPFHPLTFLDNITQLSPFGVGQMHIDALPGGLATYLLVGFVAVLFLVAGIWWAVSRQAEDHRLFWFLVLPPLMGQLVFLFLVGGIPLHRRYLMVIVAGLVPITVAGVIQLVAVLAKYIRAPWLAQAGALATLCFLPMMISIVMSCRLGSRPDWRALVQEISSEYQPTDGIVHPYSSPAPGFVVSPLFAYLEFNGKPPNRDNFIEPYVDLEHLRSAGDKEIKLADPNAWTTKEASHELMLRYVRAYVGKRIWTFSTPLTEYRAVDLAPHAILKGTWNASGLQARLYEVSSDVSQEK